MIKNKKQFVGTARLAATLMDAGLEAAKPSNFLAKFIKQDYVLVGRQRIRPADFDKVYLVAVGKAAYPMAQFTCRRMKVDGGVAVVPKGHYHTALSGINIIESSHPIPTRRSVTAAKSIIELLRSAGSDDLVLFFISGGASSLVSLPQAVSLEQKQKMITELLRCGATIHEINALRKHLSGVKGGQILRHLRCKAASFVMSDVVGDDLSVIGSGLTYCDKTTFSDCLKIIKKYHLRRRLPRQVLRVLEMGAGKAIPETPKNPLIPNVVVATNKACLLAMAKKAMALGYGTRVIPNMSGDVDDAARKIIRRLGSRKKTCLVFGGETTVVVHGKGRGGRNQELVLHILRRSKRPITAASVGTDGIDGNTKYAGAIFSGSLDRTRSQKFIAHNDSNSFFRKYGGLVMTGPTQTNLMDIGVVILE